MEEVGFVDQISYGSAFHGPRTIPGSFNRPMTRVELPRKPIFSDIRDVDENTYVESSDDESICSMELARRFLPFDLITTMNSLFDIKPDTEKVVGPEMVGPEMVGPETEKGPNNEIEKSVCELNDQQKDVEDNKVENTLPVNALSVNTVPVNTVPENIIPVNRVPEISDHQDKDKPIDKDQQTPQNQTSDKTPNLKLKCKGLRKNEQHDNTTISSVTLNLDKIIMENDFSPGKIQATSGELGDEKVVPLCTTIFSKSEINRYKTDASHNHSSRNKNITTTIKNSNKIRTRDSIKNFFKSFTFKKPVAPVVDSAELENQIFSPFTHRPSGTDVPGIHELESHEVEELDQASLESRRLRSNSTVTSLFSPGAANLSLVSTAKDEEDKEAKFDTREFFTGFFGLGRKKSTPRVRILTPVTSPSTK